MSFISFLDTCLTTLKITPEELINQDIIRTEKILKVESKINPNLDINYLNTFLDAFKNNKNELLFLINETLIIQILQNKYLGFHEIEKLNVTNSNFKEFVEKCLKQDLLLYCEKAFKEENYHNLTILSNYQIVLPDEIIDFIESKVVNKLNYILENLKKGYFGSTTLRKSKFLEYASKLDSPEIKVKKSEIARLIAVESAETASTPGLLFFFKTIFRGLDYLSITPNSIEEREEKKYALKEMYFIFKILGGIAAFMIIAFYFINIGNNERKEKIENQRKMELSKTILGHVSNYTPNDVVNFISLDTFPTGSNVLQLNEEIDSRFIDSSKKFKVTNNSNFDVILISHDLINDKYNTSYFIKKKDTLTVQCLYFHLCFGNELGKFALKNENEDFRKALPRFKKPYQYTTNTIDDLLSVNGDLVLESKHDVVYIESKKPFNISSNDGLKMKITFK